jgi:hypothetical protein
MRQLRSKSHAESTSIGIVSTWVIPKNGQFNKGRDERPSNLEVSQSLGPRCTQIFWRKKTCHHTGNVDNICGLQKNPWLSPKLPKAASATPFRVDYHMGRRLQIYLQNRKIFDCSSICADVDPEKTQSINRPPASITNCPTGMSESNLVNPKPEPTCAQFRKASRNRFMHMYWVYGLHLVWSTPMLEHI